MQSWLEGRVWVEKCAQATWMTASLRIRSSKADSNTWESFTRSELKLESVHQESPRSDIFRKRATSHVWTRNIVRNILPGLKRKRTGLLLSGPKSSFQKKVNVAFNLEIKFPESGGRVERHRIHVALSPVWSFHSQWWFGPPCHLLVLVHCVFSSPVNAAIYQEILEHFMLPSSFMEMLISFPSRTWHLPTLPKVPKAGSMTMVLLCLIVQQSRLTWTPENLWSIVKRKMRDTRPNNADDLKAVIKATWACNTWAVPQADRLHATPHWCSNSCKRSA